jgi:phytoene synthase
MQMLSPALAPDRPAQLHSRREGAGIAPADLAVCRELLANGSRTFLAASYLLPKAVRDPACALYAFCRVADDAIDEGGAIHADSTGHGDGPTVAATHGASAACVALTALAALRERLDRVYRGHAPTPGPAGAPDRAFAAVVRHFAIPRELPEALLEGFAWDAAGRRYETLAELQDYAARVAGAVGAMMALVMGARSPAALARACDLGVAMQLSNIARDVGEDARAGRVYLPLAWLREAGIDVQAWLAAPSFDARIAAVVERVLAEADALYAGVDAGVAELPAACRVGINAARFLYADIGHEVRRRGGNSVDSRAVVSPARKLALLAVAATRVSRRSDSAAPPLPATRYLVAAATGAAFAGSGRRVETRPAAEPARSSAEPGRVVWLIDLFERLEREDRMRRGPRARQPAVHG